MAQWINSFNAGQLSPLVGSRTDIPIYNSGCRSLRNFYVNVAGGVERRQGSRYLKEALSTNSRLIPFIFNRDESYTIELTDTYILILDSNGEVLYTLDSPYSDEDIVDIKYKQVGDIIWLVSPSIPPYNISRSSLSPLVFEINEVEFDYPPFLEENLERSIFVTPQPLYWLSGEEYLSGSQVQYNGEYYFTSSGAPSSSTFVSGDWSILYQDAVDVDSGITIILNATSGSDIFSADMVGAYWRMRHDRSESKTIDEGILSLSGETSQELLVDGKNYSINITNEIVKNYKSSYISKSAIQSNTGGGWVTLQSYDTYGVFTYDDTGGVNEIIRVIKTNDSTNRLGTDPKTNYKIRTTSNRRISDSFTDDNTTAPLDVSFSNWEIRTGGTWNGTVELEKSIDGGETWNVDSIIGDTNGVDASNFIVNSPFKEGANTFIRIKYTEEDGSTGTFKINLNVDTNYSEGICKITKYISPTQVEAEILNRFGASGPTNRWSEGSFSVKNGYPTAVEYHDGRIVFSGTIQEPNTVYMSYTDDFYNFLLGTNDSDSIKIKPNTNEPTTWLLSTGTSLYQGTRGSVVNIATIDGTAITPSNITVNESLQFGGSDIQALKTNETVVFLERINKKLREIFYSDQEKGLISRDLTIFSNEIGGNNGFVELILQRTPDQIIYGLREDGLVAGLTYERSQDVFGWALFDFGGNVKSIVVRPSSSDDELWIVVERDNGTYIEKLGSRIFNDNMLDAWFVDSGIKTVLKPSTDILSGDVLFGNKLQINSNDHGFSDGDLVRFSNTSFNIIDDKVFAVSGASTDSFIVYLEDKSIPLEILPSSDENNGFVLTNSTNPNIDGLYVLISGDGTAGGNSIYENSNGYRINSYMPAPGVTAFSLTFSGGIIGAWSADSENYPWSTGGYTILAVLNSAELKYNLETISGSVIEVSNIWDGLDHLEDEMIQVMGDGGFEGEYVVSGGEVITDGYYNQAVIGKRYLSIIQPMYFESSAYPSNRYNKTVLDAYLMFYRTIGGYSGIIVQTSDRDPEFDFDELESDFPNLDKTKYDMEPINLREYSDRLGESIIPFTGNKLINYNDTYSRIATQFVICDTPTPMTLLGAAINLKIGG